MIDTSILLHIQLFLKARTNYELSTSLTCKEAMLTDVIKNPSYAQFYILKKSGGYRTILAPKNNLKNIQKKLSKIFNYLYIPNNIAHGFIKKAEQISYNTLSNARAHIGKNFIWNIDITNFFSSIPTIMVADALMKSPFNFTETKAKYISLLICYKKQLPTGSPCSPIVSNIVCQNLDTTIQNWVETLNKLDANLNLVFTRYADDITFSSSLQLNGIEKQNVYDLLASFGFEVNAKKNREQNKLQAQWVTGIKVNEKPNLDRKYIRLIRSILHQIHVNGLEQAAAKYFQLTGNISSLDIEKFINSIKGKIEYIGFVKGKEDANYIKFTKEMAEFINVIY